MQSDILSIDYKIKISMNSEEPSCSLLCSSKYLDQDLIFYVKINMHIFSLACKFDLISNINYNMTIK